MLVIDRVSKTYPGAVTALHDVSLAIPRGLFGLLGPNGAGKSTLMRTLATLQAPDSGRVLLDGRDAFADPDAHRRRLGYLPQEFGVYPGVPADELLDHLALLKGLVDRHDRRAQVEALLARTNLWPQRRRAVSGFSGGMRRRFGIAQALLGAPSLVIVDEPTAGLDPEERYRFHDLLCEIGEDVVVLLSTHIVEDVRRLCPRMAILVGGRVARVGAPEELIAALDGRVWSATLPRTAPRDGLRVLSTQLHAGQSRVRVLAAAAPPGFAPAAAELEDAYFEVLS